MSQDIAPAGEVQDAPVSTPAQGNSVSEAAAALAQRRWDKIRQAPDP